MNYFLNLTTRVINKAHIVEIIKQPNKYEIHMSNHSINGILFCSSGFVNTNHNIIQICNEKDKEDYETITKLIKDAKLFN
jgi:hypothetical protein